MIGRYVQIDARPRAGAPARELADLGVSREWRTVAHTEDDPDAIAAQLKEIRAVAPSQLYETRIGRRAKNPPAHLHVPETVAQLGTVLDLTTVCGSRRTLWEAADIGGMIMASDADAMQRPAGAAALYLLRVNNANPPTLAAALDQVWGHLNSRDAKELLTALDHGDLDAVIRLRKQTFARHEPTQADVEAWDAIQIEARDTPRTPNGSDDAARTYQKWHKRDAEHVTNADGLPNVIGVFIGHALRIGYRSDKWHERGQFEDYDHDYTEPKYKAPEVWADRADLAHATAIVIVGGNQRITPQGID